MKERIQKILVRSTELSRRAAEKCIVAGEVTVNKKTVTELGSTADPNIDDIRWKGRAVRPHRDKVYLIYNKPKERLVTKKDPLGRQTIWSDLRRLKDAVNAVGRLDYDSEGLLILTNDGELINRLTHPSRGILKVYNVKVKGFPSADRLDILRNGLKHEGVSYMPAQLKVRYETGKNSWIEVKISEGKNRQVKKMFSAIGHPVLKLKRIAIGPVRLGSLEKSGWRYMTRKEIAGLFREVGMRVYF